MATLDEKKWKAEEDARILAEAETIKMDQARLKAAAKQAQVLAKESQQKAQAMTKIAGKAPKPAKKGKK